jgi:hypothetical protein
MKKLSTALSLALAGLCVVMGGTGAGEAGSSPFANKPADSYSGTKALDGSPLLWGQAPVNDFGSREVTFNLTGVRAVKPAPAPGVHPRIMFGPDELPDIRDRLKHTRCGQEAWKNILSWTEMMKGNYDDKADYAQPDRWNGGFGGLHGRVPLFRLGVPREKGFAYNHHPKAAQIYNALADGSATDFPDYYWNTMALEAFRCLIDNDTAGAKKLSSAVLTALKLDQAKRELKRAEDQKKNPKKPVMPPAGPVGGFQLAFCYDFLFNQMTPEQRKLVHDELAASTWSHDNYGTFNTAETSRSNWATFSYWLYEVLAIEGEEGFNELKVRGMYRGWRNLMTYGWFQSGATFEGEAKNQLGMDGIILFSQRAKQYGFDNLSGHPYLQAYARSFLPHSANPMLTGFHKYDLLGGSRSGKGGATPMDSVGLKYMFPDDKRIDWYYRMSIGENYEGVPDRPDGYYNALLFYAVFASDFDQKNADPKALNLGNTFFCGERSLMMTRSDWTPEATQLNLHTRQANGGHPFSDRNAIMIAGAGRVWSPNGYASFRTQENSVVGIDNKSQQETVPGRMVDFADTPEATFAVGDAKYAWDWKWKRLDNRKGGAFYTLGDVKKGTVEIPAGWEPELNTVNSFAFLKLPYAYLNRPMMELGHWIAPSGALSPVVRQPNYPVVKAFRTAGLVRGGGGDRSYVVVADDIQKDQSVHHYDWTLALEYDVQIAKVTDSADGTMDILLTGSDPEQKEKRPKEPLPSEWPTDAKIESGQPMLLVRVVHRSVSGKQEAPRIVELPNLDDPKKYGPVRRLIIPTESVSPEFRVLIYPHRQGESVPSTQWKDGVLTVTNGKLTDQLRFTQGSQGRANLTLERGGRKLLELSKPVEPLK